MSAHCWADRQEHDEKWKWEVYFFDAAVAGETCMLEDGHEGPHEWTSDREIGVSFEPVKSGDGTP